MRSDRNLLIFLISLFLHTQIKSKAVDMGFVGSWKAVPDEKNNYSNIEAKTIPCIWALQIQKGSNSLYDIFIMEGGDRAIIKDVKIECRNTNCTARVKSGQPLLVFSFTKDKIRILKTIALSDYSTPPSLWGITGGQCNMVPESPENIEVLKQAILGGK